MEIKEFIASLEKSNFSLAIEKDKLILKADKKIVGKDEIHAIKKNEFVINYIKENKSELIQYLSFLPGKFSSETKSKNISSIYRLSSLQEGMLFHGLYNEGSGVYIEQFGCDITGLDLTVFNKSWDYVLKAHSILRSAFYYNEFSVPVQCVYREVKLPVEVLDYRHMNKEQQTEAIKVYEGLDRNKGFDLKVAPLMRVGLLRLGEDRYRMVWTWHHILFDGWSTPILMEKFLTTHELLAANKEVKQEDEDRYEDYIRYLERSDKGLEEIYWRNYMKGVEQSTFLPFVSATKERNKGIGFYKSLSLQVNGDATKKIEKYAQKYRITVNTIMQGVWSYLLQRYTGNSNIVYGVIVSGRPDDLPNMEHRVGMYINNLPLHTKILEEQGIVQCLQGLQEEQVLSRQYQHTALQDIQRWTGVQGDLFDSLLVFENYPVSKLLSSRKWSLQVENVRMHEQTNYPFNILISAAEEINISFLYNSEIVEEAYVSKIQGHFEHVLLQIINNEKGKLSDIELLTREENHQVLVEFNNTTVEYAANETIVDLLEAQVIKTPDTIALLFEKEVFTYEALNAKVNQLAHYLKQQYKLKADETVAVLLDRSSWSAIAMLAIIKTGACYVPIDVKLPEGRLKYIIDDAAPKVIITSEEISEKYASLLVCDFVKLSLLNLDAFSTANQVVNIHPDDLSYVIYTSGSTGMPKGVMQTHRMLHNLIQWANSLSGLPCGMKIIEYASFAFDSSLHDLCFPLTNGGTCYVLNENIRLDFPGLAQYIVDNQIEIVSLPFSALSNFFNIIDISALKAHNIKHIISTGEQLVIGSKMENFLKLHPQIRIHNLYGPSETHVVTASSFSAAQKLPKHIPIGKPISNSSIYILNKYHHPVPLGVVGEIFIGGHNLARGYLKNDSLTKEKFIANFFVEDAMLYKTGDMGRWLPDGSIEYLGRFDDQVKIRGYRIELGEIESLLQQCELVKQAIVLANEDKEGNKRLIGYIVPEKLFDRKAIVSYLKDMLPEYMIPALWMELEHLPLTPNGKVNKKALPDPDASALLYNQYVAPRNEVEEKLVSLWRELLGLEKVGVHDNFFELGGHSLLAIRVISAIRKELKVDLAIKDLFSFTTISDLSKYVEIKTNNYREEKASAEYELLNI